MCRIPHTCRRQGRYVFRRRVHFRNLISKPIGIALQTADPKVARQRAALLSARFAIVKSSVERMMESGRALTGAEIEALFREELEREVSGHVQRAFEESEWASSAAEIAAMDAEVYSLLRSPDRHAEELVEHVRDMIPEDFIAGRLAAIGAPVHPGSIAAARTHLIRARAVGSSRAQRLFDDDVLNAPDPVRALLADLGEPTAEAASLLRRNGAPSIHPVAAAAPDGGHFLIYDSRRFGDIIEDVIAALKAEKIWKEGYDQKRRIMQTFAWITGNRELGSYDHRDVAAFKAGLLRLPTTFRFGTLTKGAMARPFADVVSELESPPASQRRNNKTINRDLSTMSTVAKHLEQTAWKSRIPGAKVMDFSSATIAIKESDSTDLRPPWTTAHLQCLFGSPIYVGGGAGKRRLKESEFGA